MSRSKKIGFTLFLLLFLYAFWNARNLILGPRIDIVEPAQGTTLTSNPTPVTGIIKNAAFITLNGTAIFTDNSGVFAERVSLYPGYNSIVIEARDRFGKQAVRRIAVYYEGVLPDRTVPGESASTTEIDTNN